MEEKIGIDTNIFIELFESAENLDVLKEKGYKMHIPKKCLWEMVKYIKTLSLKDTYYEGIVARFMRRNQISFIDSEISQEEIKNFEEKCKQKGIGCHYPDSEFILAFQKEGIKKIYTRDVGFRKAAQFIGIEVPRFDLLGENKTPKRRY